VGRRKKNKRSITGEIKGLEGKWAISAKKEGKSVSERGSKRERKVENISFLLWCERRTSPIGKY